MNSIDIIKSYLAGSLSPQDFQKELYYNKDIEDLLSEENQIPPYTSRYKNAFLYLIEIDILLPSGELDSKDLLSKFLAKRNINFSLNNEHKKKYDLFMKIQPSWLNLTEPYFNLIMNKHRDKVGVELERALKLEIKKDFKFLKNRPKWLQSPNWPTVDNKPLIFIGQLDITQISHDITYLYIFLNEKENTYMTFEQST
ncbi:MAG: hypothetical protein J6583_12255 [Gilliamella sp.]|uniref:hypothetical protein n=1 Tax=Gilliamella sp. TaxID=1891236 RepID=UPI0025F20A35|nr:hypothetical protein [Gilliamella sp.]MCO6548526.1 hypothetical protein [Gilliamella sp.]MCO6550526.1 hypothetical protein [Gilliamella sp.]MCO6555016.1 hypothetical protein [Gilliamella sp.]